MFDLKPDGLDAEEAFFRDFARQFTLAPEVVYLMNGQKGSMPAPVLQQLKADIDRIARDPFGVYVEDPQATRETIARGYGAHVDEIAISRNTTDALASVLMGLDWRHGDEILVSALEHPAAIAPVLRLAARYGVAIRLFGIPAHAHATADEVVAAVARQLVPGRTKVLLFSSPLWPTGMRMPERALARLAQAHGVVTVVDGAHYAGMFEPRLSDSGIDFWALCGHKWQSGPGGTGILYVRNRVSEANPLPLPRLHLVRSATLAGTPLDGSRPAGFDIGAALTNAGSPESGLWRALGQVCAQWDQVGRARIERWILGLADYLRSALVQAFGPQVLLQPARDPALQSGVVAFNPFMDRERRRDNTLNKIFRDRLLAEHGIRIAGGGLGPLGWPALPGAAPCPDGLIPNLDPVSLASAPMDHPQRANACVWTHRAQIDAFVQAAHALAMEMQA
jgi:isopenicillin-N epimerase